MEESLNNGRAAEGPLSVSGLQPGDFIFVDGPVRAVVRRESLRPRMFWLDGDLDLRRTELKELGANRYQVIDAIATATNYSLREERGDRTEIARRDRAARQLAGSARRSSATTTTAIRSTQTIAIEKLRAADLVYVGKGMAVVVRREGP